MPTSNVYRRDGDDRNTSYGSGSDLDSRYNDARGGAKSIPFTVNGVTKIPLVWCTKAVMTGRMVPVEQVSRVRDGPAPETFQLQSLRIIMLVQGDRASSTCQWRDSLFIMAN